MYPYSTEKMPREGFVLAYFSQKLVFEPYCIKNGEIIMDSAPLLKEEDPREIHFFDQEKEHRVLRRDFYHDFVEITLKEDEEKNMDPDLLYVEDMYLLEEYAKKEGYPEKLRVVNRYQYSVNDTLVLRNYRIALKKE